MPGSPASWLVRAYRLSDGVNTPPKAGARDEWLSRFVSEHGPSAYRTAYRLLRDRDDAHDAVQDTLFRAFQSWSQLDSEQRARSWFFKILVNECMARLRRRAVRDRARRVLGMSSPPRTPDPSVPMDVSTHVLPLLMDLPIKQRTALVLRFGDDRSVAEIASAMGVGSETVKTHLKRGLAQLRRKLQGGRK